MPNASHVFNPLNIPINVFSKSWTVSAFVGKAIITLILSLCTQPLNELAELHFRGLNLKILFRKFAFDSNI